MVLEKIGFGNFDQIDYGNIENEVYDIVLHYKKYGVDTFFVTDTSIHLVVNDISIEISILDNLNYINIYNIVDSNKSLYKNGKKEKINFVGTRAYFSNMEVNENIEDNICFAVFNYEKEDSNEYKNEEYTQNLINNLDRILQAIKEDKKKEEGKGYLYYIESWYNEYETNELIFAGTKLEFEYEDFEEEIEKIYATAAAESGGGEFVLRLESLLNHQDFENCNIYFMHINDNDGDGKLDVGEKFINVNYEMPEEYTY